MPLNDSRRRLSYAVLCVGLVIVTIVFGVRVAYTPVLYFTLAAIQLGVIGLALWKLGASAIRSASEKRQTLALAGGLLVMTWGFFSFLPGIGPPGMQTHEENQLRYLILLIDSILITYGLLLLRESLSQAGEQFYSTLGFSATILAAPLYLTWATLMLGFHRAAGLAGSGEVPSWITSLSDVSDILLFFGGVMIYMATAAFAVSLRRTQWLGRRPTSAFVTVSFLALICLVTRGLAFPDPAIAFAHWYTIPGWVAGIPAIPWIMPCMFGVILLQRAGTEQA